MELLLRDLPFDYWNQGEIVVSRNVTRSKTFGDRFKCDPRLLIETKTENLPYGGQDIHSEGCSGIQSVNDVVWSQGVRSFWKNLSRSKLRQL